MATKVVWIGQNGIYRKFYDTLTVEDVMQENLLVLGDPRSDDLRYLIADFTAVTDSSITTKDAGDISLFDKPAAFSIKQLKIAFVVSGEAQQALVRLYELNAVDSNWEFEIFETIEAAREWVADVAK